MNKKSILLVLFAFALYGELTAQETSEADTNFVILMSIDGFPASAMDDENIPLPTIRKLAREGAYAKRLIPSSPTRTWTNHTSIITGVHPEKHGILLNGTLVRNGIGEPVHVTKNRDRDELTSYPTLYDVAIEQGLSVANLGWPVTRNVNTFSDNLANHRNRSSDGFWDELTEAGIIEEGVNWLGNYRRAKRDQIRLEVAEYIIKHRQPNLLLFHQTNVDGAHHAYGKNSLTGHLAMALADMHVRVILDQLKESGKMDKTTIFITSDHGFMNVTKELYPNILLKDEGYLERDKNGNITKARIQVVPSGGAAIVYVTDPDIDENDLKKVQDIFKNAEGIKEVIEPKDYGKFGLPTPSEDENIGELLLGADDGYAFGTVNRHNKYVVELDNKIGKHGYLNNVPEMEAIFIAYGKGIKSGTVLESIDNRSVAPTIARILGFTLQTADGEVLNEIIK
ncbi:MAG: ectonucleotide pyrophosphatase/phosphodiesterase [Balneolaceae bacterium]